MQRQSLKLILDFGIYLCMFALGALIFYGRIELYLKFLFLFLCFLSGFLYHVWIKKTRGLLKSVKAKKRVVQLMEKATEVDRVSFNPGKSQEETTLIFSFLKELLGAEKFIIWAKKGKEFEILLGHNIPKSLWRNLKGIDMFVSKVETLNSPTRIDQVIQRTQIGNNGLELTTGFRYFLEKIECNWILPLGYRNEFLGFILLNSPREKMSDFENRLAIMVCNQIGQGLRNRELKEEIEKTESQLYSHLTGDETKNKHLTQVLKKKLFDLHSLFKATEDIYNILDKERLFFTFLNLVKKQLESKWVVIFLPEGKSGDLAPKCCSGIELGSFHGVVVKRQSHFFSRLNKHGSPLCMYDLDKSLKNEWITTLLSGLGVQLACKLVLADGDLGMVFVGEKITGIRYDSIDLANFEILTNMITLSLRNIKKFKVIEEVSYTDSMTGLYNNRYFYKRLNEEIFRAKRFGRELSLVIFDIDNFKVYNDTYGHQAGDALLKQLGEFIPKVVRSMDVVSRYGGEEFCVIMPETDGKECGNFMDRLRKSIMDYPFKDEYLEHIHHITVSLGGAIYPRDAVDAGKLIYYADMALLRAKNTGKNRSIVFSSEKFELKPTS